MPRGTLSSQWERSCYDKSREQEREMKITFGKHLGKHLEDVPFDYLQWLQDPDRNPNGVIRNGVNWSDLAFSELQRRSSAYRQEIVDAQAIFTKLPPNTHNEDIVKTLTRELVAALRANNTIDISEENIKKMMLKAGYAV